MNHPEADVIPLTNDHHLVAPPSRSRIPKVRTTTETAPFVSPSVQIPTEEGNVTNDGSATNKKPTLESTRKSWLR